MRYRHLLLALSAALAVSSGCAWQTQRTRAPAAVTKRIPDSKPERVAALRAVDRVAENQASEERFATEQDRARRESEKAAREVHQRRLTVPSASKKPE